MEICQKGLSYFLKCGLRNVKVRALLIRRFCMYLFKGRSSPRVSQGEFPSSVQVSEILVIGFLLVVIFVLVVPHSYFVMFKIASERFDGYQEGTIVPSNAKFVC